MVFTRRLKLGLIFLVLGSAIAYGVYIARLSYTGYCFAAGKYLTDEEKIRVALVDLLKKYPPAVIRTPVEPNVWSLSVPKKPIYYRNVDEFLSLNPDCCKVNPMEKQLEGGSVSLVERLTGAATSFIEVGYTVRYRGEDNTEHSIRTVDFLYITNCGTPGDPLVQY